MASLCDSCRHWSPANTYRSYGKCGVSCGEMKAEGTCKSECYNCGALQKLWAGSCAFHESLTRADVADRDAVRAQVAAAQAGVVSAIQQARGRATMSQVVEFSGRSNRVVEVALESLLQQGRVAHRHGRRGEFYHLTGKGGAV